jgi:hypothetical protein
MLFAVHLFHAHEDLVRSHKWAELQDIDIVAL